MNLYINAYLSACIPLQYCVHVSASCISLQYHSHKEYEKIVHVCHERCGEIAHFMAEDADVPACSLFNIFACFESS